jgi:hypothetical protein
VFGEEEEGLDGVFCMYFVYEYWVDCLVCLLVGQSVTLSVLHRVDCRAR